MAIPTDALMPLAMLAAIPASFALERRTRTRWQIATADAHGVEGHTAGAGDVSRRPRAPLWIVAASWLCIAKSLLATLRVAVWSIDASHGGSSALIAWRVVVGALLGAGFAAGAHAFLSRTARWIPACVAAVAGLLALESWDVIASAETRDVVRSVVLLMESALLLSAAAYVTRRADGRSAAVAPARD